MHTLAKTLAFFLLLYGFHSIKGQDIHFSQFFNSPLTLNPANTGNFDGDWRINGNFRNQWKALALPYRTAAIAYDRQFYIRNHHISAGIYMVNDESGDVRLKNNQFYLSGAYHRTIHNHSISIGFQAGYVSKKVVEMSLPGDWQPNNGVFSPSPGEHLSYPDINLGIAWQKKTGIFVPEIGVAFYHLNHPKESFFNDNSRLSVKSTVHGALLTNLSEKIYLKPEFFTFLMNGSKDLVMGSELGYTFPGNQFQLREAKTGLFFRNGITGNADAMVALFGIRVSNLDINISYDFNISPLKTYTNNRGAFEISFVYKSLSTILKTFTIPCERI